MNLSDKIVIYRTADGQTTVDVRMDGDTVWLSQAQMAELFQTDRTSILRHIKNIYIVKQNWFAKKWNGTQRHKDTELYFFERTEFTE